MEKDLEDKARLVRLDISSDVGRQAASRYGGVSVVPTLVVVSENAPVYKQTGIVKPGAVIDQVDRLLTPERETDG